MTNGKISARARDHVAKHVEHLRAHKTARKTNRLIGNRVIDPSCGDRAAVFFIDVADRRGTPRDFPLRRGALKQAGKGIVRDEI